LWQPKTGLFFEVSTSFVYQIVPRVIAPITLCRAGISHLQRNWQVFVISETSRAVNTLRQIDGKTYDLNGPDRLDGHAQAAVFSSVLGRPVRYLDVSADDFIGQLKSFGLPPWMVEAFGVAVADPEIPGSRSSAEVERIFVTGSY
jgi:hypothetical protein